MISDALYYNATLTLSILQKLGVATEVFNLWFQMSQQAKKSGMHAHFRRVQDKKICCLGLTSLFVLPGDQLPGDALGRVFKATLDLLVAYMDQVAEAAKQEDDDDADDNEMDGFQTEDEDDDEEDREMGDEADSVRFQKLAAQDDDDYSDDEELQSPIDEVDPFIFFVDTIKALQGMDPARFQSLMQMLDFHYQVLASGVAQHTEQRRAEIEKDKVNEAEWCDSAAS
ncbi:hypothetical protein IFM89_028175 [Coptis chinensis]|uniref:Importin beta-like SAD2 n=1 Tax=Coptis chinensis TaxID=261450 RepID=A0A835HXV5_9MAGN|nr:hypothetical protein IFM89_028175 [Coptis chinensis]